MIPTTNQDTILLKSLLSKFVELLYISEDELQLMGDFILSKATPSSMFKDDSEIYETLIFLRELAEESSYHTIEELVTYFDSQNNKLKELVEPLLSDEASTLSGLTIHRLYDHFLKTEAVKMFTTGSYHCETQLRKHCDFVHDLYHHVNQDVTIKALEGAYKTLPDSNYCFKALRRHNIEISLKLTTDRYYERYLESFEESSVVSKIFIRCLKTIKKFISFRDVKQVFKILSIIRMQKLQRKKIDSLYQKVFEELKTEQTIENEGFKSLLGQVMLFSKMNNDKFRNHLRSLRLSSECPGTQTHLDNSHSVAEKVFFNYLSKKRWSILKSPQGRGWITTDNPGFSIDLNSLLSGHEHLTVNPNWTDIDTDTMIYFPLSKDYCIRLQPLHGDVYHIDGTPNNVAFEISSEEEFSVVNKLVFTSKPDVIISEERGIEQRQCSCSI